MFELQLKLAIMQNRYSEGAIIETVNFTNSKPQSSPSLNV